MSWSETSHGVRNRLELLDSGLLNEPFGIWKSSLLIAVQDWVEPAASIPYISHPLKFVPALRWLRPVHLLHLHPAEENHSSSTFTFVYLDFSVCPDILQHMSNITFLLCLTSLHSCRPETLTLFPRSPRFPWGHKQQQLDNIELLHFTSITDLISRARSDCTFSPRSPGQPWIPWGPLGPGSPRSPCKKQAKWAESGTWSPAEERRESDSAPLSALWLNTDSSQISGWVWS